MGTEALSSACDAWAEAKNATPELTLETNWGDGFSVPTEVSKGKQVITTKWHPTWKAEEKITRARFVAREFAKFAKRFDVFAPASTGRQARSSMSSPCSCSS